MLKRSKEVIIVGGGIAGLALARMLNVLNAPCRVTILERHAQRPPDRQGIMLAPNGLYALACLGALTGARARGHMLDSIEVIPTGKDRGARFDYAVLSGDTPYALGILPSTLVEILLRDLDSTTEVIHGHALARIDRTDGRVHQVVIEGAFGKRTLPADIVVGADGVNSAVRPYVTAQTIRLLCKESYVTVIGGGVSGLHGVRQYVAPGRMLGIVPVSDGRTFLFWLVRPGELSSVRAQPFDAFKAMMIRFAPIVREPLKAIQGWDQAFSTTVGLSYCRTWHADNVVLMGDAVHAATPSLAQGANMALMDAVLLGQRLADWCADGGRPADLADRLHRYQLSRQRHTALQYHLGRLVVTMNAYRGPLAAWIRPWTLKAFSHWRVSHRLLLEMISGLRPRPSTSALHPRSP